MKIEIPSDRVSKILTYLNHRTADDTFIHEQNELIIAIQHAQGRAVDTNKSPYQDVEIVHSNVDMLKIIRLFLEKIDVLNQDERQQMLTVIKLISNPVMIANTGV